MLATTVLSVVLVGCSTDEPPAPVLAADGSIDLSGVTLHVGDQVQSVQSVLKVSGQLDELPYKVEWASFTAGPPLLEALNAKAIDLGSVGDSPPVLAQAAGIEARIVSVEERDKANDFLLTRDGTGIRTAADLKGKSVAVAKGSSSHGLLIGLLQQAGLSQDDVTVRYLAPPDAQSAFAAGQVDAWAVWNPYYAVAIASAGAKVVADGTTLSTGYTYTVASTAALADPTTEAAIKDFLVRLVKARAWAAAHPDQWVPVYSQLTNLPASVATVTFDTSRGRAIPIDDRVIARQQELADRFAAVRLIPSAPKVRDFFDDRFNADVTAAQP
ncbi:ABC transporter substrate-binding protein [Rhodococcus sp. X156]|uniref:ABC transporter substrate-binding protein n=1 Tax=Rhodococcus sp. X156 TaxID=2499145 RepID=UPI001F49677C|nr:ABC transporter substrate-binding protein [Rhodococcus sp. X156]